MTTAMRAAIMLAVLVGLPAAWVYYGPLPARTQHVVDRFVETAKEAVGWDGWMAVKPEANRTSPQGLASPVATRPVAEATSPRVQSTLAQQVEPLVAELRRWGAVEYRLEPWGSGKQLFRFCCEMPLGDGVAATEVFEAVAADPRSSIAQVVVEIQSWRASRLTAMR